MRKRLALCLALLIMTGITAALPGRTEETATGTPLPGRTEFASTSLSGASDAQRNNIRLAVAALDGARVATGGTFSFNDVVGPRTREQGYVSAINGSGAKKLGGGVSQVATTLYLALKQREGIDYLQKRTYGNQFAGNYVDSSYDAIITDSKKSIDFRFINNLSIFYIHIRSTETAIECRLTDSKDSVAWDVSPTGSPSPSPDGGTPVTPTPGGDENQNAAPSLTPGAGQSVTPAPTPESGASRSASSSPTPDVSHTPSLAPDANQNVTHAPTPGANQSVTPAHTPGASQSATPAPTPGASRSVTPAPTPGASRSVTPAPTPGASQSVTPAPTPGASRSVGPSRTPDASQSVTPAPRPETASTGTESPATPPAGWMPATPGRPGL